MRIDEKMIVTYKWAAVPPHVGIKTQKDIE